MQKPDIKPDPSLSQLSPLTERHGDARKNCLALHSALQTFWRRFDVEPTGESVPHLPGEVCYLLPPRPSSSSCSSSLRPVATTTASARSQWALPDLSRQLRIAVGTSGPQAQASDRSGHCRTSTVSSRSQWALPDLNRKRQAPDRSGQCRTSTASSRSQWAVKCEIAAGTTGPQPQVADSSGQYRTNSK